MSTPLVISVTDELVAELEAIAEDASFVSRESDSQEYLANLATRLLALLAERAELKRKIEKPNIAAAAKKLAECMDYPWSFMPELGRRLMVEHATAVIDAAMQSEAKP